MKRFCSGAFAALLILGSAGAPARAAGENSDVVVEVRDAASGVPIALARVLLEGETGTIGYTDAAGSARFESVPTGSYRAAIVRRDYLRAESAPFDVVAGRSTTVAVRLARTGALKQIGGVTVTTSPARASREVGQDDALRQLDGSLRDALGDLPGLTSSGGGVGIDGNDPSQTGTTVDGVPIPGTGSDLAGRGVNADLFAGAGASSGASHGSLGGSVGFRTLQPTRFPQEMLTLQYGSGNASSAQFAARGSLGNLGYVVQHASRGVVSPLTGQTYLDTSGLSYVHDGDTYTAGDLAKLRWSPSLAQTLTATASATREHDGIACAQQTALLPCGNGPGLFTERRGGFATLSENAMIGETSVFVAGFATASRGTVDLTRAAFAGLPSPSAQTVSTLARGISANVQVPASARHEIALSATAYGLLVDGTLNNGLGTAALTQRTSYRSASVADRFRPDARLTLSARAGYNGSAGNASVTTGAGVHWQPVRDLAYDLTASAGDAGSAVVIGPAGLPDPRALTFHCADGTAVGGVAAVNAARQRSSSLRGSVERAGKRARVALTAWTQRLGAAPVLAAYDAETLGLPASYLQAVDTLAASPYVCGANAAAPSLAFSGFVPADQIARGATLAGTVQIGAALLAGYASVQSRFVTDPTALTQALSPAGTQVPDTPLHRAGLVATERLGKSVDLLANVSYTSANNPNRLPAYTLVNAGLAAPVRYGTLALVGRNLTNRFAGPILAARDVLALPRAGGAPLPLDAQPLAPRSVALTYTVRAGRLGTAGNGATAVEADADDPTDPHAGGNVMVRGRRLSATPPADPLAIDRDNEACTPVAARAAQPALARIGTLRDAAERAKANGPYPASIAGSPATVSGITLRYVPYENGARYAIAIAGPARARAALINCMVLGIARPDDLTTYHLYAETPADPGPDAAFLAFSPSAGVYLVPAAQRPRGGVQVEVQTDPVPPSAPADPFALRAACPASSKPLADAAVAAVRGAQHGTPGAAGDIVTATAHGTGAAQWIAVEVKGPPFALLQCLHVAAVPKAALAAAGLADDRRGGLLGFAPRFGFYLIAGAGPGEAPRGAP